MSTGSMGPHNLDGPIGVRACTCEMDPLDLLDSLCYFGKSGNAGAAGGGLDEAIAVSPYVVRRPMLTAADRPHHPTRLLARL